MRAVIAFLAFALVTASATIAETLEASAQGDDQLYAAFIAAWVRVTGRGGPWDSTLGQESAFAQASTCLPINETGVANADSQYPFPEAPRGALAAVLETGVLNVGLASGTNEVSPSGLTLIASLGGVGAPPTGLAVTLFDAVVQELGAAYARRYLSVTYKQYATVGEVFDALQAGAVDAAPLFYEPGEAYGAVPRYYAFRPSPCLSYVSEAPVWVSAAAPAFATIDELKAAALAGTATVTTSGLDSSPVASAALQTSVAYVPVLFQNFDALISGDVDAIWGEAPLSTQVAQVQRLGGPGHTINGAVTTFFRQPALEGAAATTTDPAIGGGTYPPSGAAAAVGMQELKLAYGAAFSRAVASGAWKASVGNASNLLLSSSCLPSSPLAPFPTPTPGGALDNANTNGLRATYIGGVTGRAGDGSITIDTMTNPPSGATVQFFNAILAELGAAYLPGGGPLPVTWGYEVSSTVCLTELRSGKYDIAPVSWGVGGAINGKARVLSGLDPSPCITYNVALLVWVPTNSPLTSVQDLLEAITVNPSNISVVSTGGAQVVEAAALLGIEVTGLADAIGQVLDPTTPFNVAVGDGPTASQVGSVRALTGDLAQRALGTFFPALDAFGDVTPSGDGNVDDDDDDDEVNAYRLATVVLGVVAVLALVAIIVLLLVARRRGSSQSAATSSLWANPVADGNSLPAGQV